VDVPAQLGAILDVHRHTPRQGPWDFQTRNGTPYSHEHVQGEFKRIVKLAWPKKHDTDPDPPEWALAGHAYFSLPSTRSPVRPRSPALR